MGTRMLSFAPTLEISSDCVRRIDFMNCGLVALRSPVEISIHGVFMFIGVGLLAPLGVFLPVFGRNREPRIGALACTNAVCDSPPA